MTSDIDAASLVAENKGIPASDIFGLSICFLILLLDGFDTTSIAFVAPALAHEWNIPVSAFTPAFVATSIGAVIGYVVCGPLAHSFGQRVVGGLCVTLFGAGTLATALAWDIASLSGFRFVAAIGLGGTVPITIVAATGLVTERRKEMVTMLVASGLSAGAVVGGLSGGPLLRGYGWQAIFVLGGVLPLLVLPIYLHLLGSARPLETRRPKDRPNANLFAQLFTRRLAGQTALLWTFSFLIFVVTHALIFWTPSLLLDLGFDRDQAPLATAAFGMGGLTGNLLMVFVVVMLGTRWLLALTTILAMACIIAISQIDASISILLLLIAGLGAGTISGCIGGAVLAISLYPQPLRATGVGCATAVGRVGSIFGPAAGGLLLASGWPAREIFLTALAPAALALLTLAGLGFLHRHSRA